MKNPDRSLNRPRVSTAANAGFTLVEMLVAVALVVLMLMLFAQIFGDTVRIMREQNSLAHNDQKARSIETVLRSDLARMSFRQPRVKGVTGLVPLRANWPVDAERQRGYFYISENDVESALDDVIQFTIDGRETHRAPEVVNYRGRAAGLGANAFSPGAPIADVNQPDWDDGNFSDNVGESHAAEVVYFLRGGNLYRRQLLLREPRKPVDLDPTDAVYPPAQFDAQPGPGPLGSYIDSGTLYTRKFVRLVAGAWVPGDYVDTIDSSITPGTSDFWNDFDYSAWSWWQNDPANNQADQIATGDDQYWLMFNGVDSLKNVPGATQFPLGMPQYRFGHRPPAPPVPDQPMAPPFNTSWITPGSPIRVSEGQPVEYLLSPTGGLVLNTAGSTQKIEAFIGRYTHEETSNPLFGYPGVVPGDGFPTLRNPMLHLLPAPSPPYAAGWDANGNSIIDDYEGGPRAGEDLILAGVDSFDIEVWDDGFSEPDVNGNNRLNMNQLDPLEDRNGNGARDQFPGRWVNLGHSGVNPVTGLPANLGHFRHANNANVLYGPKALLGVGADGQPGVSGVDDNNDGTVDNPLELGWPYSDDMWNRVFDTWHPDATAGNINADANPNDANFPAPGPPYQVLRIPLIPGVTGMQWQRWEDSDFDGTLDPGEDLNSNGALDGTAITFNSIIFPGHEDRNYNGVLDPSEDGEDWNQSGMLDMGEDLNGNGTLDPPNGILDPGEDRNNNGILDGPEDRNGNGQIDSDLSYYYMPVALLEDFNDNRTWEPMIDEDLNASNTLNGYSSNLPGAREPEWLRQPGTTVVDYVNFGDIDSDGSVSPRERRGVVWQCFDNRIGLQMIRITVRYRDPASGAPRQVSIVHSFVE